MSYLLFIRPPLETRKIHIHTVLFPEPKVRQRKLKYAKILSKTPRENYFLSKVYINSSFASGIFNELSHLLLSTLETCLNSFQTPIPFLSRRNRTNESVDMPQKLHSNAPSYLKSFLSVTNLTSHEYIFSRVKLTSCALIRSDWFSASMRRQMSLDPLSPILDPRAYDPSGLRQESIPAAGQKDRRLWGRECLSPRAERCVTERGARTGLQ